MKKKLMALLLVLAVTLSAAACGTTISVNPGSAVPEDGVEETEAETVHPCRIVQPGTLPSDYETAIAAVNEKLAADGVNIEVEIIRIPWDVYEEKLNVMLSTGEEFEILHIMQDVKNLSSIAGMGALQSVDQYVDKYPELKARFSDTDWSATLYNGEHYAIPDVWKSLDNNYAQIVYRKDIMQQAGYEEFPETPEETIEMMSKMQELIREENGMTAYHWMHQNQNTAHWLHRAYDTFPFNVEISLGLVLCRQDGTIESFYESEEFKKDCEYYRQMYEAGLINPDILNLDSQTKYDDADYGAFLPSQTFDPNEEVAIKKNVGIDADVDWIRFRPETPDMVYTLGQNMNAISATAEDPETACKFFNWLYASQENFDLFHYGVEGVHYTLDENGRISQMEDEQGSVAYAMDTWMTGYVPYNRFNADATENYIDYTNYVSDNYWLSPMAGFAFDASNVQTELTNLETELIASIYPIKFGMVSYEENIDAAIEKLKAAGLDTYLEEYRNQFNAYLEANPEALEAAKEVIVK